MQTNTEHVNPLERQLEVNIPGDAIEAEVQARLQRLSRTVKVHGFRPGKVPMKMVEQQYGGQVRREVLGDALQKGFADAVRSQNLRVAGYPSFDAKDAPEGAGHYQFVATFEVYPEIQLGDIGDKEIERPVAEVAAKDVDSTIEILRKQRVQFEKTDRPANAGDRLEIDYRGVLDGAEFPGGSAKGYRMVLGEGRLLKDFEDQLAGMAAGQSKSFELTFPEDYHGKDLAGKTVTFEVTVNAVEGPKLPEVNADFARALGVAEGDLEKMRAEIKGNLERELKKRVQGKLKEQVMQMLLDSTQVELPKALVSMEIERLMRQARQDFVARGMDAKDIPLPADIFEEQAKRRVSLGLILAEIVKTHSLEAKPEQVRRLVEEHADSYEQPAEVVKWYYDNPDRLAEVESLALEDNVVAWALSQAKVTDKATEFDELMRNS